MLQELGYPWVMRKVMIKYGSKSTDIIKTKGSTMKIVTVNAKGSWTRVLDTDKPVHQVSAFEGQPCKGGRSLRCTLLDGSLLHSDHETPCGTSSLNVCCVCRGMLWGPFARPAPFGMGPSTSPSWSL